MYVHVDLHKFHLKRITSDRRFVMFCCSDLLYILLLTRSQIKVKVFLQCLYKYE